MNVLVTGGGTLAPIDDVRVISNLSSGEFSAQISEAFLERDARVWHICTPNALQPWKRLAQFDLDTPDSEREHLRLQQLRNQWIGMRRKLVLRTLPKGTVSEYEHAVHELLREEDIDVAVMAMAASDFAPRRVAGKIESDEREQVIVCQPVPKVIRSVRQHAPDVFLVGFKLLSGATQDQLILAARQACVANQADLVVANDMRQRQSGCHTLHLVQHGGLCQTLGPQPDLARLLVSRICELAQHSTGRDRSPK